ncbi:MULTISPECIES: Asp23/Gls24 family envelope stress response protein [unclassified Streptomyces]|uniref:Asp23/Gls24 family envelope stress response protein n=1 Tax=unclassified Streptomyces TaxID=2593676 RepID=UPI0036E0895F
MNPLTRTPEERETATAAGAAAVDVPGVAYLSPRLTDRLRSRTAPGVTVRWRTDPAQCAVTVSLAVRTGYQAARVAQHVREAVVEAVYATYPQTLTTPVTVSVTVTAIV